MSMFKNKIASLLTCAVITAGSLTPVMSSYAATATLGDCNSDGKVNSVDAVIILKDFASTILGKESTLSLDVADVNKDGKVNSSDAVNVLKYYAGTIAGVIKEDMATYSGHLLYDHDVAIDFINIDTDSDSYNFNLKIHNYANVDRIVQVWYMDANGKEVDPTCSIDVPAGGTVEGQADNADITLHISDLTNAGLKLSDVEYFTFSFHVADYDSTDGTFKKESGWSNHWDSAKVTLKMK